ncbi:DUF6660 family protein [Labilibaculum euxinus]|uniref:DUF6660 family protein n=1 Tax=Labilibaculum euxinus TaxID=2686357 RepID=UPI000FF1CA45
MKFIAAILSIYVMVLTTVACADAADKVSVDLVLLEQSHSQPIDVDLCSPFCICVCCQTVSQPVVYYNALQNDFVGFNLITPSLVLRERKCIISFFRPPKV